MSPVSVWPILSDVDRALYTREVDAAIATFADLATKLTVFPGGGVPAHKAREAATLAAEIRGWLHADS